AFYGDWFMEKVRRGEVCVFHPYGRRKFTVSLKPEHVAALVFWSKNYAPFFRYLDDIEAHGHRCVFFFTITGLPKVLEPRVPPLREALATFKALSRRYSPRHVLWRYDPIVLSNRTPPEYHVKTFRYLCRQLEGYTHRCYISYVNFYPKVKRNLEKLAAFGWIFPEFPKVEKIHLAEYLAGVAAAHGIEIYSCCNNFLTGLRIHRAHCVDVDLLSYLFGLDKALYRIRPTRSQCGCYESIDIGAYKTCWHRCLYCYAGGCRPVAPSKEYLAPSGHDCGIRADPNAIEVGLGQEACEEEKGVASNGSSADIDPRGTKVCLQLSFDFRK
ncbi:MAG: DUF1848 domain-containing protein, partial [Candidatus Hadarchaeum sp.]|uniref:DUF1848 domain-containing protein n=1 Tax=Candidatus Hadarchaeum sp. TaxID=2883567 RepID=UPI00316C17F5